MTEGRRKRDMRGREHKSVEREEAERVFSVVRGDNPTDPKIKDCFLYQ